ncbi:unnamed protein product [Allacma fusca]|uniref:G-protein coupled receptors family 2 profile 2 domain-containing protein n=1 Tax=Allacma fusca TaxID=39272 RepID=A0A8J2JQC5_9HEXA|nr:unnamed protein product [Allacma fusca]
MQFYPSTFYLDPVVSQFSSSLLNIKCGHTNPCLSLIHKYKSSTPDQIQHSNFIPTIKTSSKFSELLKSVKMNAIAITFATLLAVASAGPNGAPAAIAKPQLTLATPSIAYSAKVVSPNAKLIRVGRDLLQSTPVILKIPENLSEGRIKFEIQLNLDKFSCPYGVKTGEVILDLRRPLDDTEKYESYFSSSGYFRHGNYYYPPEVFCISSWTDSNIAVQICGEFSKEAPGLSPECDTSRHCIPKCCPMNMLLTSSAGDIPKCHPRFNNSGRIATPTLYAKNLQKSSSRKPVYYFTQTFFAKEVNDSKLPRTRQDLKELLDFSKLCFRIVEDGALYYLQNYNWIQVHRTNYCIDGIQFQGTPSGRSQSLMRADEQYFFMLKHPPKNEQTTEEELAPKWIFPASVIASTFYLLNFLFHLLLWKEQKLPGWLAMSEFATLFFSHLLFGVNFLLSDWNSTRFLSCVAVGASVHFFYISGYCWLTAICFSLFFTFRKLTSARTDEDDGMLYIKYALFGWGFPLVFVAIAIILDIVYSYDPCNQVRVPQYGVESCFISTNASGPYVIYPVSLLVVVNTLLFSITSCKLYAYSKSNSITKESFSQGKKFFKLISRLIFVMGLTWIVYLAYDILWKYGGATMEWYWETLAGFIVLQSVAIFLIYNCKRRISTSLKEHYPILIPLLGMPGNRKSYQ